MKYCKECGKELKPGAQFCNDCGTRVDSSPAPQRQQQAAPKKKMSRKNKIILWSAIAAVVILITGYKTGEAFTSKERLLEKFETAVDKKDAKALAKVISTDDNKLKINDKTVKGLITYYDENPEEFDMLVDDLHNQSGTERSTEGPINLKMDGKKLLFYDNYQIDVTPYYITLSTDYKDTVLKVDGEEVGTADSDGFEKTFGPYVPGTHKLSAALATDFTELAKDESIDLMGTSTDSSAYLQLDGEDVELSLGLEEMPDVKGKLYVNGKETEIDPYKDSTFGPVLIDGSMTMAVETEYPWGTAKTEDVSIDSSYMSIPALSEDMKQQLIDRIVAVNDQYAEAQALADKGKLKDATTNYQDNVKDIIESYTTWDESYQGSLQSTLFDMDSFLLDYKNGKWYAQVDASVTYKEDWYGEDEQPELTEETSDNSYTLIYDEKAKKWLVNDVGSVWSLGDNTKEVVNEEPTLYKPDGSAKTEVATTSKADVPETASALMDNYLNGLIVAINNDSFDSVAPYMEEDSELYKAQVALVDNLTSKSITENLDAYEITGYSEDGDTATITTKETITINYSDGSSESQQYDWTYTAKKSGDDWKLTKIE
ncbi:zinc-ribbon domain-containing protein [Terribacillus sp. 179-K 1B1 HS]|uniref:zinc ribbon domain-containing protein n=1 Tax=Terribacillus sp. 179-K 1B1 HS TaxID=3142388 RepID=UPI0039A0F0C5